MSDADAAALLCLAVMIAAAVLLAVVLSGPVEPYDRDAERERMRELRRR